MAQNPQPSANWTNLVDTVSVVAQLVQRGFSLNVTSGPYLSGLSVQPARAASPFPWVPVLALVGGMIAFIWVVSD